jgi:hypothetical protein
MKGTIMEYHDPKDDENPWEEALKGLLVIIAIIISAIIFLAW